MCGIAEIYNLENKNVDLKLIDKMISEMSHRGPDGRGKILFNTNNANASFQAKKDIVDYRDLGLGHCRLKVIDLYSNAHQPMSNEDNTIWIVFSGTEKGDIS